MAAMTYGHKTLLRQVKKFLGRKRRRWDYNIKMIVKEVGYEDFNYILMVWEEIQPGAYEHGDESLDSMKEEDILEYLGNWKFFKELFHGVAWFGTSPAYSILGDKSTYLTSGN
jgi:hypothetical protein